MLIPESDLKYVKVYEYIPGGIMDLYTIIIHNSVFGSSKNPTHPQGYWQYCGEVSEMLLNSPDEKLIDVNSLPEEVIKVILNTLCIMKENDERSGYNG